MVETAVCTAALQTAVSTIFEAVGVPAADAFIISKLMVDTDLRGVSSHGVQQATRYVSSFADGTTNTQPDCRVLKSAAATAAMTGDGGLGIVVGAKAMELAIVKARQHGVGCVTTIHHSHIGSAGK
jgi:L-2-hydroxycarboxylate dehydrogenase (NAD+)